MKRRVLGPLALVPFVGMGSACHDTGISCEDLRNCRVEHTAGSAGTAGLGMSSGGGQTGVSGATETRVVQAGGGAGGDTVVQPPSDDGAGTGGAGSSASPGSGSGAAAGMGWGGAAGAAPAPCAVGCGGGPSLCDVTQDVCVECLADSDCHDVGSPVCHPVTNTCVGCVTDANCGEGRGGLGSAGQGSSEAGGAHAAAGGAAGGGPVGDALAVCNLSTWSCVECTTNAHCSDPTPICHATKNTCVGCAGEADCQGERSVCDLTAEQCVQCLQESDCQSTTEGSTPHCDVAAQQCVECFDSSQCQDPSAAVCGTEQTCQLCAEHQDCARFPELPYCDSGACVQCVDDADCPNPAAPRCYENRCEPCTASAQCLHIDGLTVCDPIGGECVECTAAERESCGEFDGTPLVCDSLAHTCTDEVAGSATECQQCVSDAHCAAGQRCVMQMFQGAPVGYFCFWRRGDSADRAPAYCESEGRPYVKTLSAVSIDGDEGEICGLAVSTCPARQDFRERDCGASPTGGEGGGGGADNGGAGAGAAIGGAAAGTAGAGGTGATPVSGGSGVGAAGGVGGLDGSGLGGGAGITGGWAGSAGIGAGANAASGAAGSSAGGSPSVVPDDTLCGVADVDDGLCVPWGNLYRCTLPCMSDDDCPVLGSGCSDTELGYCLL